MEIDAAEESGNQESIVAKLGDERASDWLRIPSRRTITAAEVWQPIGHGCFPWTKLQRLERFPFFLRNGLEFSFKVQAGDFAIHRPDQFVIHREGSKGFFRQSRPFRVLRC